MEPVNKQAARGISYGPGEKPNREQTRVPKGSHVLTMAEQQAIRAEMRAAKAKRAEKNRQKRARKKARAISLFKRPVFCTARACRVPANSDTTPRRRQLDLF
jgi:hypothetical protein